MKIPLFVIVLSFNILFISKAQTPKYLEIYGNYTLTQLNDSIKNYLLKDNYVGLGFAFWATGKTLEKQNQQNDLILLQLRKGMDYFNMAGDSLNYYRLRGEIGFYYMYRPFLEQFAVEYLQSSSSYFQRTKNFEQEIGPLINLANIYVYKNNYEKGDLYLKRSEWLSKKIQNKFNEAQINATYSDYYTRLKKYPIAIIYGEKSLKYARENKVSWMEGVVLYYLSRCMQGLRKPELELKYLLEAKKISEDKNILLQLRKEIYDNLRVHFIRKNNLKMSYYYAMKLVKTQNEIYYDRREGNVEISTEYKYFQDQQKTITNIENDKIKRESEIKKLQFEKRVFVISIISIVLVFLLVLYLINTRIKLLTAAKIATANKLDSSNLNVLIQGQEIERNRIASELHDSLGTTLSRLKFLIDSGISIDDTMELIDDACEEVRKISENLAPYTLENEGLVQAIDQLIVKQKSTNPKVVFQYFGNEFEIEKEKSLLIYRIVQELLSNSLKHARATQILVQVIFSQTRLLSITVEDNGIGYDPKATKKENFGLKNIKARVYNLKGEIEISTMSKGTTTSISFQF